MIDLHTHTTCSDGSLTPIELLDRAKEYNLEAIAITDHDNINAYTPELFAQAKKRNIELVPGIEFSTRDATGNKYHLVGLLIDLENQELISLISDIEKRRREIATAIMKLLQENGWQVDIDQVLACNNVITKPHISKAVINNPQNATKLHEIFGTIPSDGQFIEETMIKGKPCFFKAPEDLSPRQAIDIIHTAKGLAFLAHPNFNISQGEDPNTLAEKFLNWKVDGFEAICVEFDRSNNDKENDNRQFFTDFAFENNLLISGGSDFHQQEDEITGRSIDLGFHNHAWEMPYSILEAIKNKRKLS